ncbi:MAG: hypothetical protein AB1742_00350 [bacterium]
MAKLTGEEKEIMAWGSKAFKEPWLNMCAVFRRLHLGEKLSREQAGVDPFFLPVKVDGRLAYRLLKSGGKKAILGDNGSMLTVITNTRGNRIIWASLELEEDGAYTEFHELSDRLGSAWDAKGAELIFDDLLADAFEHFRDWVKTQDDLQHVDLGILKVANVQFFGAFKKAWEESDEGRKVLLMTMKLSDAIGEILEEGWIRFHPEVNLKKLLDFTAPVLNVISTAGAPVQKVLEKLPF